MHQISILNPKFGPCYYLSSPSGLFEVDCRDFYCYHVVAAETIPIHPHPSGHSNAWKLFFFFFRTLLELFSQFSFSYVSLEFIYMCMLFFLLRIQLHSCMRKEIQIWTARTDLSIGFCFGGRGSSKYGMRLVRAKQIRTACCWNWRRSVWMYTGGKLTKQAMPKHGFIRLLQQKKLSLHPSWPPLGNLIFRRRSVFF